jgi:hypothetical protein
MCGAIRVASSLFFCDEGVGWLADGLCDSVEFHPKLR